MAATHHTPVAVVEANLLNNNVAEQVPDCGEERGKLIATLIATPNRQRIHDQVIERSNQKYIECYHLKCSFVLLPVHLQRPGKS